MSQKAAMYPLIGKWSGRDGPGRSPESLARKFQPSAAAIRKLGQVRSKHRSTPLKLPSLFLSSADALPHPTGSRSALHSRPRAFR